MIKNIIQKYKFDIKTDRIGPDCPFTHYKLYFKSSMKKLCKKKFRSFGTDSEFRAGAYAFACSNIIIGDRVTIRPNTMLFAHPEKNTEGTIQIENDVLIGSNVHMYVTNHKFNLSNQNIIKQGHSSPQPIKLKEGCWIGSGSIILPGVTIGKNAVVGAGSIVTKDIPSRTLYAGNPAKLIRKLD